MTAVVNLSAGGAVVVCPGSVLAGGLGEARPLPLDAGRRYMLTADGPVVVSSSSKEPGGVLVDVRAPQIVEAAGAAYARALAASTTRLWVMPLVPPVAAPGGLQRATAPRTLSQADPLVERVQRVTAAEQKRGKGRCL